MSDLIPAGSTSNAVAVKAPVAITEPLAPVPADTRKYYICTVEAASMFRGDGKKLAFVFNTFVADDLLDQQYMEAEIKSGNIYLRAATQAEIDTYNMRTDPRGTIENQLRSKLEAEVRATVSDQIRAELIAELTAAAAAEDSLIAAQNSDVNPPSDATKLATSDLKSAIDRLKITAGNATVSLAQSVVSTAQVKDMQAG